MIKTTRKVHGSGQNYIEIITTNDSTMIEIEPIVFNSGKFTSSEIRQIANALIQAANEVENDDR